MHTGKLTENTSRELTEWDYVLLFEVGCCLREVRGSLMVSEVSTTKIKSG